MAEKRRIFEGVKILNFTWVVAGPLTIKYLSDNGATVVHVESSLRPDPLRIAPPFWKGEWGLDNSLFSPLYHTGEYSCAINMSDPRGIDIIKRLVKWADVVADNYSPRAMAGFGLTYDDLVKIKPDIIMWETCMQGQTGPARLYSGFGNQMGALSGFASCSGFPDGAPVTPEGAYTDIIEPHISSAVLAAALLYKKRTGKAVYIDNSQFESGVSFFQVPIMDYIVNGRLWSRDGNRDPYAAPHGIYPCLGEERWVAIAVTNDEEWAGFCEVIARSADWVNNPKFATLLGRKQNEDELDRLVGEWTKGLKAEEVMVTLQAAGVPAGLVSNGEDLFNDPQLKVRNMYPVMEHKLFGPFPSLGQAHLYSELDSSPVRAGSNIVGQDTDFVLKKFAGMSDAEIKEVRDAGVLT